RRPGRRPEVLDGPDDLPGPEHTEPWRGDQLRRLLILIDPSIARGTEPLPTVCRRRLAAVTSLMLVLILGSGCGRSAPDRAPSGAEGGPPLDPEAAQAAQAIGGKLSTLINEATARYRPLDYEYDEDLLTKLDRIESFLSGKTTDSSPRFLPRLDE